MRYINQIHSSIWYLFLCISSSPQQCVSHISSEWTESVRFFSSLFNCTHWKHITITKQPRISSPKFLIYLHDVWIFFTISLCRNYACTHNTKDILEWSSCSHATMPFESNVPFFLRVQRFGFQCFCFEIRTMVLLV